MTLNAEEIIKLNRTLIGSTEPIGFTDTDQERLENLKKEMAIIDVLLDDISFKVEHNKRQEASIKLLGDASVNYLKGLQKYIAEVLEEVD